MTHKTIHLQEAKKKDHLLLTLTRKVSYIYNLRTQLSNQPDTWKTHDWGPLSTFLVVLVVVYMRIVTLSNFCYALFGTFSVTFLLVSAKSGLYMEFGHPYCHVMVFLLTFMISYCNQNTFCGFKNKLQHQGTSPSLVGSNFFIVVNFNKT